MSKPTRITNSIRALRFTHGEMTQAQLAERIGVTRQTVIAIEQGRYSPSLEMAFQIARVFRVATRRGVPVSRRRRRNAMKAAVHGRYGSADIVTVGDLPTPESRDDEVLVRVHAATIGVVDSLARRGTPAYARFAFGLRRRGSASSDLTSPGRSKPSGRPSPGSPLASRSSVPPLPALAHTPSTSACPNKPRWHRNRPT
jgi:putative transcriptional regulator